MFLIFAPKPEDWYSVTLTDLKEVGAKELARLPRKELAELLIKRYPDLEWETKLFRSAKLSQQKQLERIIKNLFPVYRPSFPLS